MQRFVAPAALLASLAVAAPAHAATTIGSNLASTPLTAFVACAGIGVPLDCTADNASLPSGSQAAGGTTAPAAGVVVRWRLKHDATMSGTTARLVILNANTVRARGGTQALATAVASETFTTRLPIATGDRLSVSASGPANAALAVLGDASGASRNVWTPQLADGETRTPSATFSNREILLNADIEPDVDADGYGDETQDACPTDATTQGTCPPAPPTPTPTPTPAPDPPPSPPVPPSPLGLPDTPTTDATPTVTLARAATRPDERGRVTIRLGCQSAHDACRARVGLFRGTGARRTRIARASATIAAARDETVALQLPAAIRRLLHARQSLAVDLVVTPDDGTPIRRTLRLRAG